MTSRTTHRLQLLATAVRFSSGGAAIKATELGSWQVASRMELLADFRLSHHLAGVQHLRHPPLIRAA